MSQQVRRGVRLCANGSLQCEVVDIVVIEEDRTSQLKAETIVADGADSPGIVVTTRDRSRVCKSYEASQDNEVELVDGHAKPN